MSKGIRQAIINTGRGLPARSLAWGTVGNFSRRSDHKAHNRSMKAALKACVAC
jgi:hypothetical protein